MQQHPDFAQEAQRVRQTARRAQREGEDARSQLAAQADKVTQLTAQSGGDFSVELLVAENMLAYMRQRSLYLSLAQDKPYFSRVDFTGGDGQRNGAAAISGPVCRLRDRRGMDGKR